MKHSQLRKHSLFQCFLCR